MHVGVVTPSLAGRRGEDNRAGATGRDRDIHRSRGTVARIVPPRIPHVLTIDRHTRPLAPAGKGRVEELGIPSDVAPGRVVNLEHHRHDLAVGRGVLPLHVGPDHGILATVTLIDE